MGWPGCDCVSTAADSEAAGEAAGAGESVVGARAPTAAAAAAAAAAATADKEENTAGGGDDEPVTALGTDVAAAVCAEVAVAGEAETEAAGGSGLGLVVALVGLVGGDCGLAKDMRNASDEANELGDAAE